MTGSKYVGTIQQLWYDLALINIQHGKSTFWSGKRDRYFFQPLQRWVVYTSDPQPPDYEPVPGYGTYGAEPWTICYRAADHLVPRRDSFGTEATEHLLQGREPGRGPFDRYSRTIRYRAADHLVPGRRPFGTGSRTFWDRAENHLLPAREPFGGGSRIIWYRTADHWYRV